MVVNGFYWTSCRLQEALTITHKHTNNHDSRREKIETRKATREMNYKFSQINGRTHSGGHNIQIISSPRTPLAAAKWTTYSSSPVRIHQLMSQYLSYQLGGK